MSAARQAAAAIALCAGVLVAGAPVSGAATLHVPADFATIQVALDAAVPGDEVVVAPGTYSDAVIRMTPEGSAEAVAFLSNGVALRAPGGPEVTFIDGESARHCIVGVDLGADTVLEGFTLLNGLAAGVGGNGKWGGGALFFESSLSVHGNQFVECSAGGGGSGGGGLFLRGADGAIISFNLFLRCTAGQLGGGMEVYNSPWIEIRSNTFVDNDGGDAGGGLLMNGMSGPVENNIFYRNRASLHDGGHGCIGSGNAGVTGECNLYWENVVGEGSAFNDCGFGPGVPGNLEADPLFCDPVVNDYGILSASPAAPGGPLDCGLIGAFPVSCGPVAVELLGWGHLKSRYR